MPRKTFPGTLMRRYDGYRWRWQLDGRRVHRTFQTKDRNEAIRLLRLAIPEIEAEAARRKAGVADVTVRDLLDEFEKYYLPNMNEGGASAYLDSLVNFRRYFVEERGNPLITAIKAPDVQRYVDWRRITRRKGRRKKAPTEPVSQRTLRKDYAVLHTLFQWAVESREYRKDNPVTKAGRPKAGDARQPVVLSDAQLEKLLNECEGRPMLKLFVTLCSETAVRPNSEALWLRWEDVDLERRVVHIVSGRDGHRTKTGRTRRVPMSDALHAALKEHLAAYRFSGSPWVFHHVTTRRRAKALTRLGGLLHAFQNAAKRAKLPVGIRPYDLRHTRLTKWAATKPLPLVQKAAGHASIRTTMGYVHLSDDDLSALVEPTPASKPKEKTG